MVTILRGPVCAETILDGMMETYKETIPVFIRRKMRCIGCPIAHLHDVREACEEHHVPLEEFLSDVNRAILSARGKTP
ncbi:DUF1858 domain-containing protein [Pannonibacter sp. Pt2-lr]|uniref:DUF1858 domain-containing protein n=1 Tax=Pannonibacter anstelovis TaxID=3121537 RepID=A0ABU7ZLT1_9HYPH